ncbi:hypothetical protein DAPPUDRAFT_111162 [Daphnia pulex]|uniref:Uncharacterized protein n=1 Tax=Daphnia pulex TaxID=6669 RepID=E9H8C1_DAPPU|nr:hypothetical protein DAPPUDRAFT_111162 [Daphnia pulex]|eukprot:EFX72043.1 hypothetical protein DAPPUDRAFT_111162 [Daphnia pulex]
MPPKKIWKRIPPCKAHRILEDMFKKGLISPDALPHKTFELDREFMEFSLPVFRGVFNELKCKYGLGLEANQSGASGVSGSSADVSGSTTKRSRPSDPENVSEEEDMDANVVSKNQPVLMSVYKDPDTEEEKLCVLVTMPGGVSHVKFEVVGTGPGSNVAKVTYDWPPISFDIPAIFKEEIDAKQIPSCHPLILSLKNDLQFHRDSIDSTPRGEIELTLPISVQTATSSIEHKGVTSNDGTMVLVAHLMAYQNSYTVKQKCTTVEFKKC